MGASTGLGKAGKLLKLGDEADRGFRDEIAIQFDRLSSKSANRLANLQ
jgi:hypothetical protein